MEFSGFSLTFWDLKLRSIDDERFARIEAGFSKSGEKILNLESNQSKIS